MSETQFEWTDNDTLTDITDGQGHIDRWMDNDRRTDNDTLTDGRTMTN